MINEQSTKSEVIEAFEQAMNKEMKAFENGLLAEYNLKNSKKDSKELKKIFLLLNKNLKKFRENEMT